MSEQPQHMAALDRANEVRLARAELKRSIKAGATTAAEVIEPGGRIPDCARSMTIGELLGSQERWGRVRVRKFLVRLEISESRAVGNLTSRQRRVLAEALARVAAGLRPMPAPVLAAA